MDARILKQIILILKQLDNGLCLVVVIGCMDENYLEFNPQANTTTTNVNGQDINCETLIVNGCNNSDYLQYYSYSTEIGPNGLLFNVGDPLNNGAIVSDGCIDSLVYGCYYPILLNMIL